MHRIVTLLFLLTSFCASAQELKCAVNINATAIATSDRNIFKDMKNAIEQFMNTRKWTNDVYKSHEKINCSMLITITRMPDVGKFVANVQVRSSRPVFNTSYSSLIFNFADREWEFEYIESLPLEFNDNTFTTNLTSMLALYAYLILGVDYDSFSELGGTTYFQKAQNIVNNAQQTDFPGWNPLGSNRSRYWIVENFNNGQMTDIRRFNYAYHRLGLDTYDKTPEKSRELILKGLRDLKKVRDTNPQSILVISFLDAKGKEIANIFSEGEMQSRKEAYDIVTNIDPSNRASYDKMVKN